MIQMLISFQPRLKPAVKFNRKSIKRLLQLLLWSSTRMISLSRCGGVLWMAVWTERSSTDKASLTKMKMMLSWGRSDEYDMFLHLEKEGATERERELKQCREGNHLQGKPTWTDPSGRRSGMGRVSEMRSLR